MKIPLIIIITLLSFSNVYAPPPSKWDIYVQTQPSLAKYTSELVILQTKRGELRKLLEKNAFERKGFLPSGVTIIGKKRSLALIDAERRPLNYNLNICLQEIKIRQDILDKYYIHYLKTNSPPLSK